MVASDRDPDGGVGRLISGRSVGGLSPVQFWQTLLENGLANVQAFNEAWHRGLLKYAYAGLGAEELNLSWPAMMPYWQSDGYTIRCLNDTASVIAEGRAMSHCVANYVDSCWIGDTQIFSLRDPEGLPISTIEVGLRDADRGAYAVLIQHRAASNRQPPEWSMALVERWFASAVRTIPRDQLGALKAERRRGRDQSAPTAEVQGRKMSFERLVFALKYAWPSALRTRLEQPSQSAARRTS